MKLKNRDLNEGERRLGAAGSQLLQDRIVRIGLLAIVAFGVAALAWITVYLICLSPLRNDNPAEKAMRTWRAMQ